MSTNDEWLYASIDREKRERGHSQLSRRKIRIDSMQHYRGQTTRKKLAADSIVLELRVISIIDRYRIQMIYDT